MSEIEAFAACNDAFEQSTYYDTCLSVVPNFSNETIVNCIRDLAVIVFLFRKQPYALFCKLPVYFILLNYNERVLLFKGCWEL